MYEIMFKIMFYISFELLFVDVLYRQCTGGQEWQLVSDLSVMVVCCQTIVNMQYYYTAPLKKNIRTVWLLNTLTGSSVFIRSLRV